MEISYIARQAIFDRHNNTVGYELFFRDSEDNKFPEIDPDIASSKLIIQNHFQNDIQAITFNKKAYINFSEKCLFNKYPLIFDNSAIVIELTGQNISPKNLINIASFYHDKGYKIALKLYDTDEKSDIIFQYITMIKVDIELINPKRLKALIKKIKKYDIRLIAEKVETNYQLQSLAEIGFSYYQGFFYHKPEIVEGIVLSPVKTQMLHLINETFTKPLNFSQIAEIISHDVNLTVTLLKMVNNVTTGTKVEITSLRQAATYLGEKKLKQFVTILALAKMGTTKANEITKQSLITAKLMSVLSTETAFIDVKDYAFITGLLSSIEVILGLPMHEIVKTMPLAEPIKDALVERKGILGQLLDMTVNYITSDNHDIIDTIGSYHIEPNFLHNEFVKACNWCKELGI